ncbi:hypothetical protein CHARACLAT_015124 [Characodon lateralis]|uniref:Uncharacterized protein n=1 Tax=Characodon lateralis TaxID=208331 RepID=A0ABU7DRH2_9TELE|nr:hypothetical protein [Characodon lateralis]
MLRRPQEEREERRGGRWRPAGMMERGKGAYASQFRRTVLHGVAAPSWLLESGESALIRAGGGAVQHRDSQRFLPCVPPLLRSPGSGAEMEGGRARYDASPPSASSSEGCFFFVRAVTVRESTLLLCSVCFFFSKSGPLPPFHSAPFSCSSSVRSQCGPAARKEAAARLETRARERGRKGGREDRRGGSEGRRKEGGVVLMLQKRRGEGGGDAERMESSSLSPSFISPCCLSGSLGPSLPAADCLLSGE